MTCPKLPEIRAHIKRHGGYAAFAESRGINRRTAERYYSGALPAPAWLLAELEVLP